MCQIGIVAIGTRLQKANKAGIFQEKENKDFMIGTKKICIDMAFNSGLVCEDVLLAELY